MKYLSKVGQFMACRFLKDMLWSWLIESRKDGKTSTLEIPGGNVEEELGHALHTWICWSKRYIRFPQGTTEFATSVPRSQVE
jgi:hypothetical protein